MATVRANDSLFIGLTARLGNPKLGGTPPETCETKAKNGTLRRIDTLTSRLLDKVLIGNRVSS